MQDEIAEKERRLPGPKKIDVSSHHSAYQALLVDDEGRTYVQTWEKVQDKTGYFIDVFDAEGKYITKYHQKAMPNILKRGKMYSVEEDENGYQCVKRYKVTWKI